MKSFCESLARRSSRSRGIMNQNAIAKRKRISHKSGAISHPSKHLFVESTERKHTALRRFNPVASIGQSVVVISVPILRRAGNAIRINAR